MDGELETGSIGPGSRPNRGHCVVFLSKKVYSHNPFFHPGV